MRKSLKFMMAGVVTAIALSLGSAAVYAANTQTGSAGALADSSLTLEKMLTYAIQDEYAARAEYTAVIAAYGEQVPYTNILKAEERHITSLTSLFDSYGYTVPADTVTAEVPDSLEASYQVEVTVEENNIAMYDKFLQENLPADVKTVFEQLKRASENHKNAFRNAADGNLAYCQANGNGLGRQGNCTGAGQNNGTYRMNGTGTGRGCGNGGNGGGRGFGGNGGSCAMRGTITN